MYPYSDMNSREESMLLDEFFALRQADKEERDQLLPKLDCMTEQLLVLNESTQARTKVIDELKKTIADLQAQNAMLQKEKAALKERKKLSSKNRVSDSHDK